MAQDFISTIPDNTTNILTDNQNQAKNMNTLRSNFEGTSFPDNPVKGQKCYRSDLDKWYYYNGSAWKEDNDNSSIANEVKLSRGQLTSLEDRLAVSLNDDGTLKSNVTANISEWIITSLVPTYVNTTEFTVTNDQTGVFTTNRAIRATLESSVVYSFVSSSSYDDSTGVTTVTIADSVLDAGLQQIDYGVIQKITAKGVSTSSGSSVQAELDNKLNKTGGSISGALHQPNPVTIATVDGVLTLTEASNSFVVDGTEPVTSITGWTSGTVHIRWAAARTITHNATSLILQSGENRIVSAGDRSDFEMTPDGACETNYFPATAQAGNLGNVPPGGSAVPFTGTFVGKNPVDKFTGEVRTDWQVCDGTNGTPDLRDRFILAAGTTYAAGSTGGEATHTLTTDEIPSHSHSVILKKIDSTVGTTGSGNGIQYYSTGSTGSTGGGEAHNNMPPYYVLAYIMRIA